MHRILGLLLALFGAVAAPLVAQSTRPLVITLPAPESRWSEAPNVSCVSILADGSIQDQIRNGLPARLHFRLERWSADGMFDKMHTHTDWFIVVRYDALAKRYDVFVRDGARVTKSGSFADLSDVEEVLQRGYRPDISLPKKGKRSYYTATLEVETMDVSDLDELQRWLKGELTPAVRGKRNPGTALTRGVKRFLLMAMGAQQRRYDATSPTFE
jgi:hypothetical protein